MDAAGAHALFADPDGRAPLIAAVARRQRGRAWAMLSLAAVMTAEEVVVAARAAGAPLERFLLVVQLGVIVIVAFLGAKRALDAWRVARALDRGEVVEVGYRNGHVMVEVRRGGEIAMAIRPAALAALAAPRARILR
jgi:hypothetical protein